MKRDAKRKAIRILPCMTHIILRRVLVAHPTTCQQAMLTSSRRWNYVLDLRNVVFESIRCSHVIWVAHGIVKPALKRL